MSKVPWVNYKSCDFEHIQELLKPSLQINQLTNYGPIVRQLELWFTQKLSLDQEKVVIAVNNAALGLDALVGGINWTENRRIRYATQAFTFPCAAQGELQDSQIIDIDEEYGPDLSQVSNDVDGLIVTNLFGNVTDIEKYVNWAKEKGKILLFDNATVPLTNYNGRNVVNYGTGCIISLHHTKPLGFGEGGLVIVDKKYEKAVRKCVNFGFDVQDGKITWHPYGKNCKMSEISAAFILSYLQKNQEKVYIQQVELYNRFAEGLRRIPDAHLFPTYSSGTPFVSCLVVVFDRKITNDEICRYELHNITAKKYYTPLKDLPKSQWLFDHILCLPCHLDVTPDTIDRYLDLMSR